MQNRADTSTLRDEVFSAPHQMQWWRMSQVRAWVRFVLTAVTVLGGMHGIALPLRALFSPSSQGFVAAVLFGAMLIAYTYVTVAGVIFWRQPNRRRPLIWALAIQIPWISLPGFVYKFSAGLYVSVAFIAKHLADTYSAGFNWSFNLGSSCEFRLFQMAPIELGVNVAALAALFLLNKSITSTSPSLTEPLPTDDGQSSAATTSDSTSLAAST
jgi:hypothetical protein